MRYNVVDCDGSKFVIRLHSPDENDVDLAFVESTDGQKVIIFDVNNT